MRTEEGRERPRQASRKASPVALLTVLLTAMRAYAPLPDLKFPAETLLCPSRIIVSHFLTAIAPSIGITEDAHADLVMCLQD